MRPLAFVALLALSLLTACGDDPVPVAYEVIPLEDPAFTAFTRPARLVIRSDAQLAAAWAKLSGPLPAVDFTTEMVIVVALGPRPNSGYDVSVTKVTLGDELETTVTEWTLEGSSCGGALEVVVSPAAAIRLARTEASVEFKERTGPLDCN